MTVEIKKLVDYARIPTRGSEFAAGYDLYALNDTTILRGSTELIRTGIAMAIPDGFFGAIYARSGLATKKGLRPANCVGIIDSDYRGEIMVPLRFDGLRGVNHLATSNDGIDGCRTTLEYMSEYENISQYERVAQIIIQPYLPVNFKEVTELDETTRGAGGFGSTGTN